MRSTFFILLFICFAFFAKAQNADMKWVKQMGGNSSEEVLAITVDAAGNVYTTGFFSETVDFDPGPGVVNLTVLEDEDAFVCKMDNAGNLIWVKQFAGTSYQAGLSITVDALGNVYTGGIFFGLADFDPGPGVFNIRSKGNKDDFITKLDAAGNLVWALQIGGPTNDRLNSITLDGTGNLLVTGYFDGIGDFDPGPGIKSLTSAGNADIFLLKITAANGTFVWVDQIGGPSFDASYSVRLNAAGNIFICGFFLGTVDFDPGNGVTNLTSFGDDDIFVLKLNSDGNFIWVKQMGGILYDRASSVCIDNTGDVIITGYFDGTADFDPGPGVYNITALGKDDVFIAKLDSAGNFKWAETIGGSSFQRSYIVETDASGDIYTVGYFDGDTDFDPGAGIYNISSVANLDVFVCKLNKDGNFIWAKQFGGLSFEAGYALCLDRFKNIYTAGSFAGTVDFDPNAGIFNLTSLGSKDIFIHKIKQCPVAAVSTTLNINTCNSYILNNEVFTSSGTYVQILYNVAGCDSLITTLNLNITRLFTTVNAVICEGETYFAGGINQTLAGTYYDTLQNNVGCDSVIITQLTLKPSPHPNLGPDRNLCLGETLVLRPGTFDNYLWHDQSTNSSFTVSGIGKYWVTIIGSNLCRGNDTLKIFAIDTLPENFLPGTRQLCPGNSFTITIPGYKNYLWSNLSTNQTISINRTGKFYLTVTDFNNCKGTDSVIVQRAECTPVSIPNAFSPNGDKINDIFKPTIQQIIQDYNFVIFNRNGQKVFETREYGRGWDGTFKGKEQPTGSYVYRITYTNFSGWESVENGSVLLIR